MFYPVVAMATIGLLLVLQFISERIALMTLKVAIGNDDVDTGPVARSEAMLRPRDAQTAWRSATRSSLPSATRVWNRLRRKPSKVEFADPAVILCGHNIQRCAHQTIDQAGKDRTFAAVHIDGKSADKACV